MRRGRRQGVLPSLLLCLLALATAPAPASAAPDMDAAVRTARSTFPSVIERCGSVAVEVAPLSDANAGASGESYYYSCRVRIAPETMRSATNSQLCSLMVHEWGHLAGLEHSSDPSNFMSPRIPHNPVCGPADETAVARAARESSRELRQDTVREKLADLRDALKEARKASRRARGAKRARLSRRAQRVERRIKRLRAELRSL